MSGLMPEPQMDQWEAKAKTDTIKRNIHRIWTELGQATDELAQVYQRGGHIAMGYRSWAEYMDAEFDVGKSQAYRLLDASRVVAQIEAHSTVVERHSPTGERHSPIGERPANEAVARELVPVLRDEPEHVAEVWADVIELHGDHPTAAQTREVVQERKELKNPATSKQMAYLRNLGAPAPDKPISKQTASKRIEELQRHRYCTCQVCGACYDREKGRRL
jgi:hypothetical protein